MEDKTASRPRTNSTTSESRNKEPLIDFEGDLSYLELPGLKAILDLLPIGIGISQRRIMLWHNTALTNMLGYRPEELHGKNARMIYPSEEEHLRITRVLERLTETGQWHEIETQWVRKDGSIFVCFVRYVAFDIGSNDPLILSIAQDVTEKKERDKELVRLAQAVHHAYDAIVVTNPEPEIVYVNPAFTRITGYSLDEAVGKNPRILKSGKHSEEFYKHLWGTISNGATWHGKFTNKRKDGSLYIEDATISPVLSEHGDIVAYVAVKRDITDKINLESGLQRAQKMESIGLLAGGIAHDFNNILQSIYGYTQLLLVEKSSVDPDVEYLKNIEKATQKAIDLVGQILTFSRKSEPQKRAIDLNQEIRLTSKFLDRVIPKMIELEYHLQEGLPYILADPVHIQQILMNLSTNARDAMPDGGRLVFRTDSVILNEGDPRLPPDAKSGSYVVLEVSDTGHGIPEQHLARIYDPFFTTKEEGKGTGLGLSVVHGIVGQHKGWMTCLSEPGKGTKFQIFIPACDEVDLREYGENEKIDAPGGSETILLVDDEPFIRDIGTYMLTRAGYRVIQASNANEALKAYREKKNEISLVILDLIMPGMGGKECLRRLIEMNPKVKVLIASGFAVDESPEQLRNAGARGFIQKPYRMEQLLQTVRRVLDNA